MVNSLENIDKSKVYVDRIEGLDEVISDVISDTLTGAVSTITTSDLTAGRILVSDNNGKVAASSDVLSDLIHKTGNEIITGDKSFNSSNDYHYIHIGNTSHSYDETVNNSLYSGITFEDKNNAEVGFVRRIQNSTDNMLQLGIKGKDGTLNQSFLGIDSSGNKYMTAPTPTDTTTTSGNQVATTGWVNSNGNNVIHKTGNETIGGRKTYTESYVHKNFDLTKGTLPASTNWWSNEYTDKNGSGLSNRLACMEYSISTNGDAYTYLRTYKYASNNTDSTTLSIVYPNSGNPYAEAPASDVNGSIVTTVNKSKAANGYFQLGNGLIVNFGKGTIPADATSASVTFPKAFSSGTSYSVITVHNGSATTSTMTRPNYPKATGFDCYYNDTHTSSRNFFWIAIGY